MSDEETVVKKALRKKYFEVINQELTEELARKQIQSFRNVRFDEEEEIQFSSFGPPSIEETYLVLRVLTNYLASKLADTRAELWLKKYKTSNVC